MAQRSNLHEILLTIMASDPNVYFQPPPTIKMTYPCIIYSRDDQSVRYADNNPYRRMWRYQLTVVDRDPDSLIPDKVGDLPLCSFERHYTADGLNHDVFNLFF